MRSHSRNPRAARTVVALLVGVLVGGWVGGGLVWVLNRNKFKDPDKVAPVALAKADEVEMVPADAIGFAHVRLADMWKSDAMAEFRKVVEKAGPEALKAIDDGFVPAPSTVDRVTVVLLKGQAPPPPPLVVGKGAPVKGIPPPQPLPPPSKDLFEIAPSVIAILAFSAPFDAAKVRASSMPSASDEDVAGKKYWVDGRSGVAIHFPSDRVMVIGTGASISRYLNGEPKKDGPLSPAIKLAASGQRHLVASVNMTQFPIPTDVMGILPGEVGPILRSESMTLGSVMGNGAMVDLRANYKDEAAAVEAEKAVRSAAAAGRKKLAEAKTMMETAVKGKPGGKQPRPLEELPEAIGGLFALGTITMLDEWLADPPVKREGSELSATMTMNSMGSAYVSLSAMSVGMLLPAVQKVREAAGRSMDSNNLKQLAIAMHNYHDSMGRFPSPAWGTKLVNGQQTGNLSWRVAILPYIEQAPLYQEFHHDEPWDSPHNKALIPKMPKTYANPRVVSTEPGKTYYKVFVGGGAIFDRDPQRVARIQSIQDGTSNTILIAEGGDPVTWTKPDDFDFDPKKPLPKLAIPGVTGINVAMADGSVRFVNLANVSEQTLKNAIMANDGNALGPDWEGIGPVPFPNAPFPMAPMPMFKLPKEGGKIGPPPTPAKP